jgi:predicted nuclease of predicted toxin-antitoxin system
LNLRLLLDEDTQAKLLVTLLKKAGHDVVTINDVNLTGKLDSVVLDYARQTNRILITQNCEDFDNLHNLNPNHLGILAVYHEAIGAKDMSLKAIVKAIANLEAANIPLANQFIALNHWNY